MKNIYKTLLFMGCAIGLAIMLMSSFYQVTPVEQNEEVAETIEAKAYKNLITFQKGDLSVYPMKKTSTQKSGKFREKAGKIVGRELTLPRNNSKTVKRSKKDVTAYFEQDLETGKLSFNKGMKTYLDKGGRSLPTQAKANDFAAKFLNESGLAPTDKKELKMMHSGGLRSSAAGSKRVVDVLRTVTYGRMLNGVPVYGAGSKIIVHVGNNGEIVGVNSRWKAVESNKRSTASKAKMKTAKAAEIEMIRRLKNDFGKNAKSEIKSMALAYYDGGKNYIQPAYFFQITVNIPQVKKGDKVEFEYMGIIPALKKSPEIIEALQVSPDAERNIKKLSATPPKVMRKKDSRNID